MTNNIKQAIIIGGGPAGVSAALYLARAGQKVCIIENGPGALAKAHKIDNYYGIAASGAKLYAAGLEQARSLGVEILQDEVLGVEYTDRFTLSLKNTAEQLQTEALVLATGSKNITLNLPGLIELEGKGISYCAVCDGAFYPGHPVAVVGGGDTACEEATYLASICRKVYMIVRKPHLRASKAMQQRVFSTPNIEVIFNHNTAEVLGDESGVTGALLRCNDGKEVKIDISGFFLAIGHHPNTELFRDQLQLDAEGYIKVEPGTSITNIEGVFAAGDVRDPHYRQAVTAAASGCIAAIDCERFLLSRAN